MSADGDGHTGAPTGAGGTGTAQELPSARSVVPRGVCPLQRAQTPQHSPGCPVPVGVSGTLGPAACVGMNQLSLPLDMTECYQGNISCPSEQKQPLKPAAELFFLL